MYTICVAAHKGGVGKTTVAANLAAGLAADGPVLAVDLDPQAGLVGAFGIEGRKPSVYEFLNGWTEASGALRDTGVPDLTLLPSDLDLAGAQIELPAQDRWHTALAEMLEPQRAAFRWAVLDTPPGLGVLTHLALATSDAVICVCPPDFMAVRSLPMLLETVAQARRLRPGLRLLGLVPTFVGTRTLHERETAAHLAEHYDKLLLPGIPRRVAVADAHIAGQPVVIGEPTSAAAVKFRELAEVVKQRAKAPDAV
jgi:chromosome partitioning protein